MAACKDCNNRDRCRCQIYRWTDPRSPWMANRAAVTVVQHGPGNTWGRASRLAHLLANAPPITRGGLAK